MNKRTASDQPMKTLECDPALHKDFKLFAIRVGKPMRELTSEILRDGMSRYESEQQSAAAG